MKKKAWSTILICGALVISTFAGAALAAGNGQGSEADPLVTLSYVKKAVAEMEARLTLRIEERSEELRAEAQEGSEASFVAVEVKGGETLILHAGAQVILRGGTATCEDGVVDLSEGYSAWGELVENHLYIATRSGQAVKAAKNALFLVQGGYSVS